MIKSISGRTLEEIQKIEGNLKSKGYMKVSKTANLSKKHYKITSFTGSADSFGGREKFNIEWYE